MSWHIQKEGCQLIRAKASLLILMGNISNYKFFISSIGRPVAVEICS
jgi:hypothetical protein